MKKYLQILKISSIFVGAVLGAGFAGGRELATFFVSYGKAGILGSVISGILFIIFGSLILYRAKKYGCKDYQSFLNTVFGKNFSYIFCAVSEMFLLVCFFIMLSGSGALFYECFGILPFLGSIITAVISYLVLSRGINAIGSVCSLLSPVMLLGIIYVNICSLDFQKAAAVPLPATTRSGFLISAILYVSYNMLSCAPALSACTSLAKSRKTALSGGIIGGIVLLVLSFLSCFTLYLSGEEKLLYELPILSLASDISRPLYYAYSLILYMAILTTAFSTGLPLVKKIEDFGLPGRSAALILCLISLPLSLFKFSVLIEYCYTFFGYLGLILLGKILFNFKK